MRMHTIALLVAGLAFTVGCDKNESEGQKAAPSATTPPAATSAPAATTAAATASAAPSAAPAGKTVEIEISSVKNTMTYDKTKLSVPKGSTVHLTFKNSATMSTLSHNWVLVKPGTEASVAAAGLKLGEAAGYFDARDKDALAHTELIKPGGTGDVTFTAPDPGDYPYICTFPGHYMMMKGVLTVTP